MSDLPLCSGVAPPGPQDSPTLPLAGQALSSDPPPPAILSEPVARLLARHRLLRPLLKEMILEEVAAEASLPAAEAAEARCAYLRRAALEEPAALQEHLRRHLLDADGLTAQIERPLRLRQRIAARHGAGAEARFLQRKDQLDRVVYSLLRLADEGLARELYLRINEGEADFAELAALHAEGPERATRGVVGPVPLQQAHPVLAERLRTATPGVTMEPFRVESWWLVVRLEGFTPATLDAATAEAMASELFQLWLDGAVEGRLAELAARFDTGAAAAVAPQP